MGITEQLSKLEQYGKKLEKNKKKGLTKQKSGIEEDLKKLRKNSDKNQMTISILCLIFGIPFFILALWIIIIALIAIF